MYFFVGISIVENNMVVSKFDGDGGLKKFRTNIS